MPDALPVVRPLRVLRVITRLNVGGPSLQAIDLSCDVPGWTTRLISGHLKEGEEDMAPYIGSRHVDHIHAPDLVNPIDPIRDWRAARFIAKQIRDFQPDIVHTHHAKAGLVSRLATQLVPGTRLVHTFHGNVFRGHFGPLKTQLIRTMERTLAPFADRLIAISERQIDDLADIFHVTERERVRLVPLGFHLERFTSLQTSPQEARRQFDFPQDVPLLGIVGRLTHVKNHDFLLRVFPRLGHTWHLAIIGDGELEDELHRQAQQLGPDFAERIHFRPTTRDVATAYRALTALTVTSHSEGTPVTMIEALATGTPVVAAAVGGIPDLAGNGTRARLYTPGDMTTFVNQMRALENDPTPESIRTRALQYVTTTHSFHALVRGVDSVYREILE